MYISWTFSKNIDFPVTNSCQALSGVVSGGPDEGIVGGTSKRFNRNQ
nr:hypothetical protein [Prochlorococcus marinus]